ncbi:TetR/AcrR family transcriptional regulator [Kribbella sp. NPDC051952]|uniref:TetR/AcrR family transcriptional regulator n=1 Tax=Kribbella sp. NPDC051952 TaxID=3154851 RepID=UPI003434998F
MGHREALLAAAKTCLAEKGYARTTARDLVSASGTNLGSIGYHYGTKEALLMRAAIELMGEWSEELEALIAGGARSPEQVWTYVVDLFARYHHVWAAQFGVLAMVEHESTLRAALAEATERARLGLAALFAGLDPAADVERAREVGSYYYALLVGVMAQHVIDPEHAPTGQAIARAISSATLSTS